MQATSLHSTLLRLYLRSIARLAGRLFHIQCFTWNIGYLFSLSNFVYKFIKERILWLSETYRIRKKSVNDFAVKAAFFSSRRIHNAGFSLRPQHQNLLTYPEPNTWQQLLVLTKTSESETFGKLSRCIAESSATFPPINHRQAVATVSSAKTTSRLLNDQSSAVLNISALPCETHL